MQIIDQTLHIDGRGIPLPAVTQDAKVKAWRVPTEYRDSGFFVAVVLPGQPEEIPACSPADAEYAGECDYPAPGSAKLAAAKAAKNEEINQARLAVNRGTFWHEGKQFACDELSRSDIDGTNGFVSLYGALPPGWVGGWKAVDNTYLPISTVEEWKAFYTAMVAAGSANFAHAQALKALLADAETVEAVQAIHWGMEV